MRYYVYISDAKIDMLWPQVPHDIKRKVAHEFKIEFKVFSASRKTESETEDNRIARLEAVVSFIEKYGNLGTVDEPDDYFQGTMPIKWGPYGWRDDSPMVYFGGKTERTILGLGGSVRHLVGANGSSSPHSHSATPMLLDFLIKNDAVIGKHDEGVARARLDQFGFTERDAGLRAVELATTQMSGPEQVMTFMAKRLLCEVEYPPEKIANIRYALGVVPQSILLGTPLYVAMADSSFEKL